MNRNNFFAFISSKDENDILTVKYETKNKETVTEQFKHKKLHACPFCGGKTRTRLREDTVPENFPLFCPKCRKETIVNARKGIVTTLFAI